MLLTGFVAFSNHANAISATGGNGRMGTAINWVEWGAEHDVISGSKVTWTKPVEAGPSKWMSTRCSLEPTAGASDALSSSKSVTVYRPGNYGGDGLGQMYFDKAPGYGNKMKIGLATTSDGEKVTFDFSCSAYLINSGSDPSGNLNDSTNASGSNFFNIPLQGLVFADAESNNWTYYQSEYIKATLKNGTNPAWRLLDSYRTPGCATNSVAELKGTTMRFRSDGGQCANSGGTGPSSSMLLQGSTSASVTLKGGGKTAVALGSIVSTDFGDAPESFGVAGSMFQPTWQGGELGNGDIPSTNYDTQDSHDSDTSMVGGKLFNLSAARDGMGGNPNLIAQAEAPSPRLGAHEDGEASPHFDEDADWDDLNGDSAFAAAPGNVVNDEDGVDIPTDTHAVDVQPGADGTFSQKVRCYGTGDVRGWIDWNHDGTFEAAQATAAHEREAEASSQVACTADGTSSTGYSATLTWQLPGDAKRQISADGDPSYMRLRITNQTAPGSSNIINMQPTGITSGSGEVEDYKADVHVPTLSVLTNIVGGRKNTGDQFTMTAQAVSPSTQDLSVTTSGNENGIQAAQIGPRSTAPNSQYKISEALTSGSPTPPGDYAKADYEQVGDIVYYLNTDTSRAHPLTFAQAQQSLRNGLSVTGVRTVKGHQPKVTVKVDRDYRFGGAAASDGSKVTLVPSPSGTGVDMIADQAKFVASGTYSVRQLLNAGYKQSDLAVTLADGTPVAVNAGSGTFSVPQDADVVVTLKNVDESATLSWSCTDPSGNTLLSGSEWRLDGPGGQSLDVADCTGDTVETCTGLDQDPAVGKFKLTGLKWGKWKITETKAPEGYRLSQPFSLTLGPDHGAVGLSAFVAFHEGKPPVVPPSSGNGNGSGGNSGANGASSGANGNGALSETGSSVTQVAMVAVVTLLLGMALSAAIKRYSSKQDNA